MKTMNPETLQRLQAIAAGSAGSEGLLSLRSSDLQELLNVSEGATLKSLQELPEDARVVQIPVPLLAKAVREALGKLGDNEADLAPAAPTKPTKPAAPAKASRK